MNLTRQLFGVLMRLCPRSFRETFGKDAVLDLVDLLRAERRERGAIAASTTFVRAVIDILSTAWRERMLGRVRPRRRRPRFVQLGPSIRSAYRNLSAKPDFTLLVVTVLALGIGANSAIFDTVYATLLKPLPFPEAQELVVLHETDRARGIRGNDVSPANFEDWRETSTTFRDLAAMASTTANLTGGHEPELVNLLRVTSSFLPVLGVEPEPGRGFAAEEDRAGGERVAIVTRRFALRRFAERTDAIGAWLDLDGERYRVIGIMPATFRFPSGDVDVLVPLAMKQTEREQRRSYYLTVIGRLAPGIPIEAANEEMAALAAHLEEQYPESNAENGVEVTGLRDHLVGAHGSSLLLLLAAAGALLLIAVVNVANLLLARGSTRQREIAVRAALGESRGRMISQLMTEAFMLSVAGTLGGLVVGSWAARLLGVLTPAHLEPERSTLHLATCVFAFVLSGCVSLGVGLIPAVSLSRSGLTTILRAGGGTASPGRGSVGARSALVVSEVALALVLVGLGSITVRSFVELMRIDPGFRTDSLLTMRVERSGRTAPRADPSQGQSSEHHRRTAFYSELQERVARLPGVVSTGVVTTLPLTHSGGSTGFTIENPPFEPDVDPIAVFRSISPNYFRTLGIALREGRDFAESDGPRTPGVAVVNETLAERFFSGQAVVGRHLVVWGERLEVVGMVEDVQQVSFVDSPRPAIYVPTAQRSWGYFDPKELAVRASRDPEALAADVRAEVWAIDPDQPIASIRTMESIISDQTLEARFRTWLLTSFAAVALLLSALGVYGVLSYVVSTRRTEIGLRVALGAARADVLRLVVSFGMRLVLYGVAIGVAASLLLGRWIGGLFYAIEPSDPWMLLAACSVLIAVAFTAVMLPAMRAARMDPLTSLRSQ